MHHIDDAKLITCIVPKGRAKVIQSALIEERGISDANFHRARGVGRFSLLKSRGIGEQQEKDIMELCVPAAEADELFEFIFDAGDMGEPHGGIIFMTSLSHGTRGELPAIDPTPEG